MINCVVLEDITKKTTKHLLSLQLMQLVTMLTGLSSLSLLILAATHLKTLWYYTNTYSICTITNYCTSSRWQTISCKMKVCILGMAINFQAVPIIMKLNFNYSFQGSYGWSPSTLKIICFFVNLEGQGVTAAIVASAGDFCDNQTIIMCGDAAKCNTARCH